MLNRIIQALSSQLNGSRSPLPSSVVGAALVVADVVYFECRQRDRSGNDFVVEALGPYALSLSNGELGTHLLRSLIGSDMVGASDATAEDRSRYWKAALKKMGFKSDRTFRGSTDYVMLSGVVGKKLTMQPFLRRGGGFVGAHEAFMVTCSWIDFEAGSNFKQVLDQIRRGNVAVDSPSTALDVSERQSPAAGFELGQRVWHIVRQEYCEIIEIDPEYQHGLGRLTVNFKDGSQLSATLLAPGIERR